MTKAFCRKFEPDESLDRDEVFGHSTDATGPEHDATRPGQIDRRQLSEQITWTIGLGAAPIVCSAAGRTAGRASRLRRSPAPAGGSYAPTTRLSPSARDSLPGPRRCVSVSSTHFSKLT